ncbi:MAG TPA: hypothetical protein VKR55_00555, partial [Bradyrhizobium sp.]|uniref:hypothetical protein n=1 Tax=Bradyrhizobium sp. TaxID=376 RepID=UPI002C8239A4
ITQRRSSRPSTALLPWSPSTGTGGRHRSEMVVAINRIHWSLCPGARRPFSCQKCERPRQRQISHYERAATFLTEARMLADLALEERLDAMIDRALRRFLAVEDG